MICWRFTIMRARFSSALMPLVTPMSDEPAGVAERVHVGLEVLRPDVVEDDVRPLLAGELLHRLGEVRRRRVVHDEIDAELPDPLDLRRVRRDDEPGPRGPAPCRAGLRRCSPRRPPPWMTATFPSFRPPTRNRFRNAVMYDSQTQAASSKLIAAGMRMRWLAYATAYSA